MWATKTSTQKLENCLGNFSSVSLYMEWARCPMENIVYDQIIEAFIIMQKETNQVACTTVNVIVCVLTF